MLSPASVAGDYLSLQTERNVEGGAFGGPLPAGAGIIAQAVVANPILVDGPLLNAAALAGRIAIVQRGGGIGFTVKCKAAQDAGAVAVLLVQNDATQDPGVMGGDDPSITIPCIMLTMTQGNALIAAGTTGTDSPLLVRVGDDTSQNLGQFQGGRGSTDSSFQFYVPAAGVYPFRLVWFNGGGDANLEWFTIDDAGVRTPINDPASPVKAWINRTAPPRVTMNKPLVSGSNVTLSWTGTGELELATSPSGPWFKAPVQTNPQTLPIVPGVPAFFFRVRSF